MNMLSDLANYAQAQGLGTVGTDIFYSYKPGNVDAGIFFLDTSGPAPDGYIPTKRPGFQVFVRAADYDTGKAKFDQVRNLFHKFANTLVGSTYFYWILAVSEGGSIGRNEAGQDEFSISFDTLIR